MKTKIIFILIISLVFLYYSLSFGELASSASYKLQKIVLGNSGTPYSSISGYNVIGGTAGENIIGHSLGTSNNLAAGFWPGIIGKIGEQDEFDPEKDTLALWKLDEGNGPDSVDSSCYGLQDESGACYTNDILNIGLEVNQAGWIQEDGKYGDALAFDGNDEAHSALPYPNLDLDKDFSIELWFRLNIKEVPLNQRMYLISQYQDNINSPDRGWLIWVKVPDTSIFQISFTINADKNNFQLVLEPSTPIVKASDYKWHHVALIYDSLSSTIKFYVDGYATSYSASGIRDGTMFMNNQVVYLGAYKTSSGLAGFLTGDLDDIRITSYPLERSNIGYVIGSIPLPYCTNPPCPELCSMIPKNINKIGKVNPKLIILCCIIPLITLFMIRKKTSFK